MFNCGMMAIELSPETVSRIFDLFYGKDTTVKTDLEKNELVFSADGVEERVPFSISDFDRSLIEAGGWVDFADVRY